MTDCKADVYFLCDNTGSMGSTITPIQASILSLLSSIEALPVSGGGPFDVAFGVGNFNDFPFTTYHLRYGDSYDPANPISLTLSPTVMSRLPLVPGPSSLPGYNWPGAVVSTFAVPIDEVTLPFTGSGFVGVNKGGGFVIKLRGIGGDGTTNLVSTVKSLALGTINSVTFSIPSSGAWERVHSFNGFNCTIGDKVWVEITNNTGAVVNIYASTSFYIFQLAPSGIAALPGYAFSPQADILQGEDATIKRAVDAWTPDSGSDYSESWLYSLDRMANGAINWRAGSNRYIVMVGDAPSHTPICTALTGLGYAVDKNTVLVDMLSNNMILLGVSVTGGAGFGLDDADTTSHSYDAICGHTNTPTGQATYLANGTGGLIQPVARLAPTFSVDVVNAILDIISDSTLPCRIQTPGVAKYLVNNSTFQQWFGATR